MLETRATGVTARLFTNLPITGDCESSGIGLPNYRILFRPSQALPYGNFSCFSTDVLTSWCHGSSKGCRNHDQLSNPMNELDWSSSNNPSQMIDFLRGKTSNRKLQLFACACCRRIPHLMAVKELNDVVQISERHADSAARFPNDGRSCADLGRGEPADTQTAHESGRR
jgi:hypothetical protein